MDVFLVFFSSQVIRDDALRPIVAVRLRTGTAVHVLFSTLVFFRRDAFEPVL